MEKTLEPETNGDEFDPRRQASLVNRTFALFCCFLFLFWTARFHDASELSTVSSEVEPVQTSASNDGQIAELSEGDASQTLKREDGTSSVTPLKLVLLVDLNAATKAELTNLPGIGEALAGRIIEYRESVGGFSDVEQLLEVRGIGPKKFAAARPFCVVGEEEAEEEAEEEEKDAE